MTVERFGELLLARLQLLKRAGVESAARAQACRVTADVIQLAAQRHQRFARDDATENLPVTVERAFHAPVDVFEQIPVILEQRATTVGDATHVVPRASETVRTAP